MSCSIQLITLKPRISFVVALAAVCALCSPLAHAQRLRFDSIESGQHEFAVLVGYGENHRIPKATKDRFSFDAVKVRLGYFLSPRDQALLDVSAGTQNTGQSNSAVWATATYRHLFLVRGSTAVSWDLSIGALRMRDQVSELGTKTNFTEQLGIALQYATGPSTALNLEYKFSHISNAGIRLPNIGINASIVSVGWSWYP